MAWTVGVVAARLAFMTRWGRRRSGGLALGLAFLSLGPSGAPALAKATAQVVPWTSRPASGPQTPGPTPNTIPKGTPVCRAGQLTGGLTGTQGMTGAQLQSVVVIVNRSSTECRLSGPPTLAVFEADGAEIGTNPGAAPNQDTTAVLMVPNRSVSPIHTATPGGEAGLGLVWSPQEPDGANCLSTAPIVARMTFNFPGSTGNVVVTTVNAGQATPAGDITVGAAITWNSANTLTLNAANNIVFGGTGDTIQATGGTRKTIAEGVERIKAMLPIAGRAKRETRLASEITLALQCGGSDGYSGITANPALGSAVDELVKHGGTAVLAETPEIYGAEHLLTRRAVNRSVGEKLVERIKWWEDYCERNGGEMNNNPAPGNKAGGLTTILEKSLGAAAKGGSTTMRAVYEYAEPVKEKGFVFMDTPGFDPVGATGQVAGGSNVMCFTTGRGSAFGCKPTPSIKLATNSDMYRRMSEDMDINCGDVLDGVSIADKGREIFDKVLKVASGERTKSEGLGYGDLEFVPWQVGAVM